MKHFLLSLGLLCFAVKGHTQNYQVNFLKGPVVFEANLNTFSSIDQLESREIYQDRFYRFIQFNTIPTTEQLTAIEAANIKLLDYIPNNTYIASIPLNINFNVFDKLNIRSIQPINTKYKTSKLVEQRTFPDWAIEGNDLKLHLQYYADIPSSAVKALLKKKQILITESIDHANTLVVKVPIKQLNALINSPYISYIETIAEPGRPESDDGRHLHHANAIDGDFYGARDYDGTGISIAINDDGAVGPHIDFHGRVNQQDVGGPNNLGGTHGDMTAGIAGGAGNLDPEVRGMATGSYLHIRDYVATLTGTIPLHQDSSVLVFSSSYSNGCNGGYTNTTVLVDQEIHDNPTLMQVFSAGNSNNNDCGYGAGDQWGNITGGHKIGKNVIATANLDNDNIVANTSSRGPASDGRIKPDISAHGRDQESTDPFNTYAPGGGTSAAAPGIAGVLAQLHHAHQELNIGNTASSALLKAILLNTADDLGNDGPDFIYGWGKVNGLAAVKTLEDNQYFSGTVTQGSNITHQIFIPTGVQRAKIMVYWADREGTTTAATALVNDIDANLVSPTGSIHLPWLLDHSPNPTTLALPATTGVDHLNNMEQIAIDLPASGNYTLNIDGTTIPFGAQEYYVVYEFLTDDITVIHPTGGEGLIPNSNSRIHWNTYGNSGNFTIEYTEDNGNTWNTITTTEPGDSRIYEWNVPNTITGQARVRVSRSGSSDESDANFTIQERPENLRIDRVCLDSNYVRFEWDPVPGATQYDVFKLGSQFMDSIGTTAALFYNVPISGPNDSIWLSARALGANGLRSLRQIAINYQGSLNGQDCFVDCGSVGHDAGLSTLTSPTPNVSNCDNSATIINVSATLENVGSFTETNFTISYQVDNNPVISETYSGQLLSGGNDNFTFSTPITINTSGTYQLSVWTNLSNDDAFCNDTINQTITVNYPDGDFPIEEDFESANFPPSTGTIINIGNDDYTWEEVNVTGANSNNTTAIFVENFDYDANGAEDVFELIPVDLSQVASGGSAYLTFDVAYAQFNGNFFDGLRVDISSDCGQNFNQVYYKESGNLATAPNHFNSFAPANGQEWRNDTIDLTSYIGNSIVIRFININGYGNNLYLDNINIDADFFLTTEIENATQYLSVIPNPARKFTFISLDKAVQNDLDIRVINQNGQIVLESILPAGSTQITLNIETLSAGAYYIQMSNAEQMYTNQLIVE